MFLSLPKAQTVDPDITQDDIDALETTVRNITNNHFHVEATKKLYKQVLFKDSSIVLPAEADGTPTPETKAFTRFLKVGDTIEVYGTGFNDGVFEITGLLPAEGVYNISLRMPTNAGNFIEDLSPCVLVLVRYPSDVAYNVLKMIEYEYTTQGKKGLKSETIARLSVTYFDMTANESRDGFPASYVEWLDKYQKVKFS